MVKLVNTRDFDSRIRRFESYYPSYLNVTSESPTMGRKWSWWDYWPIMVANLKKCVFIGHLIYSRFPHYTLTTYLWRCGKSNLARILPSRKVITFKETRIWSCAKSPKIKISRSCTISLAVKYLPSKQRSRVQLPHGAYHKTHTAISQDLSNKVFVNKIRVLP